MSDEEMDVESDVEEMANSSHLPQTQCISDAGKIHSIYLKNFTTHGELTVYPGKELNILIGPNGTGKSAIVASIIIGMGGSTKILSEHNKLCDYVKNGKDHATIRITLMRDDNGGKIECCRKFGRDNKSVFTIDGTKHTEKQYLQAIHELNIQVGNLCQFLPQERVQDFAKQNAQQLFMSTQKSVCSDELNEEFDHLKEMRKMHLNGGKRLEEISNLLTDNEKRVELLQNVVDDINRRDGLAKKKDIIEKKLAWMDFEESFVKCNEIKNDLKIAQKALDETEKKKKTLDDHIKGVDAERAVFEKQLSDDTAKSNQKQRAVERITVDLETADDEILRKEHEINALEQSAAEYEQNLAENQMILQVYEKECSDCLARIESVEHVQQQMRDIDREVIEKRESIGDFVGERAKVNMHLSSMIDPEIQQIDRKITQMESLEAAKVARLREVSPDAYKAVEWLRNNKTEFTHTIYEPIMLSISARSNEYVPFIENVIANRDFLAFVCEDVNDMNKFITVVREQLKLNVNAVHSEASNVIKFKPHAPIHEMRRLGGEIYMVDCIEAPIPVVNYLCQAYKVHNVLLGNENLSMNTQQIPAEIGLFYTPDLRFDVKISRYTNKRVTLSNGFRGKNLLNVEINAKHLNELKQKRAERIRERDLIRNKRANIELKIQSVEKFCNDKYKEKNELQKKIFLYEDYDKKLQRQRQKLEGLSGETIDVDSAKEELVEIKQRTLQTIQKKANEMVDLYEEYSQHSLAVKRSKARLDIFRNTTRNLDVEIMECNEEMGRRKTYCSRISDLLDHQKRKCKDKRDTARKLTNNTQPSDGDRFPFKNDFDELPNNKDELLEEIENISNQISVRSINDQRTLEEYAEKRDKIKQLRKKMLEAKNASGDVEREMNELHRKWLPKVHEMVESINTMFGKFMRSMKCAGEVELHCPNEYDYDQYGIEIRVKYRNNADLCKLDRFIQSGGERAVAIAVYSLSLQHLSQVPFRCVDEINQGMDRSNEGRIFEMLVNNVAKLGQSQFFYVTPKLQTNFPYNEYVTCITIFNGRTEEKDLNLGKRF